MEKPKYSMTKLKEGSCKKRIPTLTTKIKGSNNYFSFISVNINWFSSPIKIHRLTDWLHKQHSTFCCIQETHLRDKDRHYLGVKGWKRSFQANGPKKQDGVTVLIWSKIDFQPKAIKKTRRGTPYSSKVKSSKMNSQFWIAMLQMQDHPYSVRKL